MKCVSERGKDRDSDCYCPRSNKLHGYVEKESGRYSGLSGGRYVYEKKKWDVHHCISH